MNNLNLKIAELLGLSTYRLCDFGGCKVWLKPRCRDEYFDPINDPVQREPLMMELLKAGRTPVYVYSQGKNQFRWWDEYFKKCIDNNHFGTATCLAFIEMKESKE